VRRRFRRGAQAQSVKQLTLPWGAELAQKIERGDERYQMITLL
jgi:hypothetical protein